MLMAQQSLEASPCQGEVKVPRSRLFSPQSCFRSQVLKRGPLVGRERTKVVAQGKEPKSQLIFRTHTRGNSHHPKNASCQSGPKQWGSRDDPPVLPIQGEAGQTPPKHQDGTQVR